MRLVGKADYTRPFRIVTALFLLVVPFIQLKGRDLRVCALLFSICTGITLMGANGTTGKILSSLNIGFGKSGLCLTEAEGETTGTNTKYVDEDMENTMVMNIPPAYISPIPHLLFCVIFFANAHVHVHASRPHMFINSHSDVIDSSSVDKMHRYVVYSVRLLLNLSFPDLHE